MTTKYRVTWANGTPADTGLTRQSAVKILRDEARKINASARLRKRPQDRCEFVDQGDENCGVYDVATNYGHASLSVDD